LKYYIENAEEEANSIPENKTVWDVMEESLKKHTDIPALEYFGREISRKEFIANVYLWAKALKALGVKENEIVAYYGPFMPDTCYMIFAVNMIGACPYFLKLAISPEALTEETKECRIAIVFDQMWDKVSGEFTKDRFEKVIIAKLTDAMPAPMKQIVSTLSGIKSKIRIPKGNKYTSVPEVRRLATSYKGEVKVPFVADRNTFITSSSGTTVGGVVKGVVATNESAIIQLYMAGASGCQYFPGERCLNHFPPTAATSLNIIFMLPLFRGMTIVIDPRVSEKDFYNQVTKYHASVICTTGSSWEAFFSRIAQNMEKGVKYDFSFAKAWAVGGEKEPVSVAFKGGRSL
jgi:acyl-coenzyme A synthetase/AMP-(fatty) acid ligase